MVMSPGFCTESQGDCRELQAACTVHGHLCHTQLWAHLGSNLDVLLQKSTGEDWLSAVGLGEKQAWPWQPCQLWSEGPLHLVLSCVLLHCGIIILCLECSGSTNQQL